MKFYVAILCVCLVQICSGSDKSIDEMTNEELKQHLRDNELKGASAQFIDDFVFIYEKMKNNLYVRGKLGGLYLAFLSRTFIDKNAKLDLKSVKDAHAYINQHNSSEEFNIFLDHTKIIQEILSKNDVPPERYNGVINLFFAFYYLNATTEEIEGTLGYLYGTETKPTIVNIPKITATDCPENFQKYSHAIDNLKKNTIEIKPKVFEDLTTIVDKFPCNDNVAAFLLRFWRRIFFLQYDVGHNSTIDACTVKNNVKILKNLEERERDNLETRFIAIDLEQLESMLSVRLSNEIFSGIMNFMKATNVGSTTDQIQNALEYLFVDVPTTKCVTETE